VAHICNPSYSGGSNQEDRGSKPAPAKSSQDPISKKLITEIGLVEWLKVRALSSSPSTKKGREGENEREKEKGREEREKRRKKSEGKPGPAGVQGCPGVWGCRPRSHP
jgi:hypothetical protein